MKDKIFRILQLVLAPVKLLVLVAAVTVGMVFVNYTVDCSGLYQGDLTTRTIVELLQQGKNVSGFSQMDHRAMAELYIQLLPEDQVHETVALGSSRVMQLTRDLVGESFFNYGVTGGDYRDLMNIFYLLVKYDKLPQRVMIGVDPWLFRADAIDKRSNAARYEEVLSAMLGRQSSYVEPEESKAYQRCDRILQKLTGGKHTLAEWNITSETLPALVDPAYFQGNVAYWWANRDAELTATGTTEEGELVTYRAVAEEELADNTGEVRLADGSVWYAAEFRNSTVDEILGAAHDQAGTFLYMEGYTALETEQCRLLEQFVTYVQHCGVEVVFYLSPYHPFTYEYQTIYNVEDHAGFFAVEPYVREFAARAGITVLGSYDPRTLALEETDFFDGLHIRESGIAKFFGGFDAEGNLLPGTLYDGVTLQPLDPDQTPAA